MVAFLDSGVVNTHPLIPDWVSSATVTAIHGANKDTFEGLVGRTVACASASLVHAFNIPDGAVAFVNGEIVEKDYQLQGNDTLEFIWPWGKKGVGDRVWTDEEFCKFFKITPETFHAWIAQGLKAKTCLDGSIRITETSADEFFRGRVIESPYLSTDEAAAYCNVSKDAFYGRVERRKIEPLPGSGKENRFTREQCDRMMKGERT